jgi:flavin-dependent dehydrogenase
MDAISFTTAEAHVWDAIVVGAGPAGATTALRLARGGQRVVLVDRHTMPRGKVCGCCLSPAAVAELEALAADLPRDWGSDRVCPESLPLKGVRLAAGGRLARIPLAGGQVVSREALDTALVQAAISHGSAWLPGATVCGVTDAGNASLEGQNVPLVVSLRTDAGAVATLRGTRVILAIGLADHVRVPDGSHVGPNAAPRRRETLPDSRIGLGAVLPETSLTAAHPALAGLPAGELVMAVAATGYCGIVRLEDGRIDLAAALDRDAVRQAASPATAVAAVLASALGGPAGLGLETAGWRATPPLSGAAPLIAGVSRCIFRVGDAAGYVEPFTGEGMGWALVSGRLAADSILETRDAAAAAARYVRDHAAHFGRHHARCRRVALSLRQPRLVQVAVRAAEWWPWAARRLAPLVAGGGS